MVIKTVEFDLDGVLCEEKSGQVTGPEYYADCIPIKRGIDLFNWFRSKGHIMIIRTSRHKEDRVTTATWLRRNGIDYESLEMEKTPATIRVDDRSVNPEILSEDFIKSYFYKLIEEKS